MTEPSHEQLQRLHDLKSKSIGASDDDTKFDQLNMCHYLCQQRTILDLFRRDIITFREGEFLASVGRYTLISQKQADWLRDIEMRVLAASVSDNDCIQNY